MTATKDQVKAILHAAPRLQPGEDKAAYAAKIRAHLQTECQRLGIKAHVDVLDLDTLGFHVEVPEEEATQVYSAAAADLIKALKAFRERVAGVLPAEPPKPKPEPKSLAQHWKDSRKILERLAKDVGIEQQAASGLMLCLLRMAHTLGAGDALCMVDEIGADAAKKDTWDTARQGSYTFNAAARAVRLSPLGESTLNHLVNTLWNTAVDQALSARGR